MEWTAWNGQTYTGPPPPGWHQAGGRWWPPGQAPPPPAPPKRTAPAWLWIPVVAIGVVGVVGAILVPTEEEAVQAGDQAPETTAAPAPSTEPPPAETTAPPLLEYPPFDEVDPYLSLYFVTLEDTTLAAVQGEERLYNLGLDVCRNLDRGNTIDQELTGLVDDARLTGGDAGSLVGAAVSDMCPHHGQLVEDYLAAND